MKACPFCNGSKAEVVTVYGQGEPYPNPDKTFVICENCAATGPHVATPHVWRSDGVDQSTKDMAVFLWDRRCR